MGDRNLDDMPAPAGGAEGDHDRRGPCGTRDQREKIEHELAAHESERSVRIAKRAARKRRDDPRDHSAQDETVGVVTACDTNSEQQVALGAA
jgi:hypothetical protein